MNAGDPAATASADQDQRGASFDQDGELFRVLVENAPDVIARYDLDLRHAYVNPRIEVEIGAPPDAFLGKTHGEFGMSKPLAEMWHGALSRVRDSGIEEQIEFEHPTPWGPRFYQCRIVAERGPDCAIRSLLAVGRNLTEQRRAEGERRRILEVVGHDLRNPLAAILLNATEIQSACAEGRLGPETRTQIEHVVSSAEQMSRLISDLLSAATLEGGALRLDRIPYPVNSLLRGGAERMRPLAAAKSIHIEISAAPNRTVLVDPDRIHQVLSNLIGNAIQFSDPGSLITLGAKEAGQAVWFTVSDTGRGIPEEQIPFVFERYWQARQSRRAGAGLGLAIVKGIVEAHGGSVWVSSQVGQGSTFTFKIPAAQEVEGPGTTSPEETGELDL